MKLAMIMSMVFLSITILRQLLRPIGLKNHVPLLSTPLSASLCTSSCASTSPSISLPAYSSLSPSLPASVYASIPTLSVFSISSSSRSVYSNSLYCSILGSNECFAAIFLVRQRTPPLQGCLIYISASNSCT